MTVPVKYHEGQFPPKVLEWEKLIPLLGPANAAIARYDGLLSAIPNASVLLSPLSTQEAVLSSRIEGTQATMAEVLEFESDKNGLASPGKREDIQEVLNYRKAMWHAMKMLKDLPLCQRVIKETHEVLLEGVRGHGKAPGAYRQISNWIGPPGCTMEDARFIPTSSEKLPEGMSVLDKYLNDNNVPDKLIQLAFIHAEFEALHPFLDGNGRLGRMLIPLFLWQTGILKQPMFYMSEYFDSNRDEYYDRLLKVSQNADWTGWCIYFLSGIMAQAEANGVKATKIRNLYNDKKNDLVKLTHSQYGIQALDWIFNKPIFKTSDFVEDSGIPGPTARRFIRVFKENGLLFTIRESSGSRSAMFGFRELLNVAEGRKVF